VIFVKRPTFLTIWLVIMTIAGIYTLYSYTLGAASIKATLPNLASWTLMLYAAMSLLNLISVFLLWTWKKVGFYLIIASAIIVASINGMTFGVLGLGASLSALLGIGILYLAMRPAWQSFK
jgi:hypothetical protein